MLKTAIVLSVLLVLIGLSGLFFVSHTQKLPTTTQVFVATTTSSHADALAGGISARNSTTTPMAGKNAKYGLCGEGAFRVVETCKFEGHLGQDCVVKNDMYVCTLGEEYSYDVINGADPATFHQYDQTMASTTFSYYFEDKNSLYYYKTPIIGADKDSFKILHYPNGNESGYSKDKNHVYSEGTIVERADPITFVLSPTGGKPDAYDKNGQYYYGMKI